MISFKKIKLSQSATSKITVLKRRTGLRPNLLCRIGLCYSLETSHLPPTDFDENGQEFNRYTLTGEWDKLFIALLIERMKNDGVDLEKEGLLYLKAHLNRGISLLHSRIKTLSDLLNLYKS